MAQKCDLCGRRPTKGATRSHSNIKTLRRQKINLQPRTIGGVKVKLCTSCLKTMKKNDQPKPKKKKVAN